MKNDFLKLREEPYQDQETSSGAPSILSGSKTLHTEQNTTIPSASLASGDLAAPAPRILHILSATTIAQPPAPPPPPPTAASSAASRAAPLSSELSVREKVARLLDRVTDLSISEPSTAMAAQPSNTVLHKGLSSLRETIEIWESQNDLKIGFGLIGDTSGDKPIQPGRVKMLAVARIKQQDLKEQEPIKAGDSFNVQHPLLDTAETLQIVGIIKEGKIELVVEDDVAKQFFTSLGRIGDVSFFDCVGDEEKAARDAAKKAKKAAKKARRRENKKLAKGEDGVQDLQGATED